MARKFEETPTYQILYDLGAGSTKVALVAFSTQKVKDHVKGKKPHESLANIIDIKGVAFDRDLGSQDFDRVLQHHLASLFQKQKGVTSNVYESPRAMAKVFLKNKPKNKKQQQQQQKKKTNKQTNKTKKNKTKQNKQNKTKQNKQNKTKQNKKNKTNKQTIKPRS